ncbi:MAG TPA: hypothetical protein VIF57_03710 [Polyangia bacterium]|jgi:hypothetical protein
MKASRLLDLALALSLGLASVATISCSKSKSGGGGGGSVPVALAGLGVTAQVPEGTTADKAIVGDGLTLQGPDLVVGVQLAGKDRAKTLAEAKDKNSMYSPTDVKEETLADGWALSFQNKGGMGTNYWVQVRRTVGGKAIWCDTTASSAEQQANALAACKSLK